MFLTLSVYRLKSAFLTLVKFCGRIMATAMSCAVRVPGAARDKAISDIYL